MSALRSPGGPGSATPCQPSSSSVESRVYRERSPEREVLPVTRSSLLPRRFVRLRACSRHLSSVRRRKREMIPADKKDTTYWDKRRKNNEAAKRSREKRRFNDLLLEGQLLALSEENAQLRAQVLNLHYHASLNIEKSKAASPSAASPPSVLASSLSLASIPSHTPAFFQPALWGTREGSSAAVVRPQETAMHRLDAKIPCFSSTGRMFNPLGHHGCMTHQGTVSLTGPCVLSHGGALGSGRSPEADVDSQVQVSSSDDIPIRADGPIKPLSSLPTFLPTLDTLRHVPTVSYPPHNWVVPHLNHSAVYDNLLPWRSSYQTPAVYPGLPLHIQGRQDQGVGVEDLIQKGFKNRFGSAP